ncbi:MAG: FtsX-like permease family protein [Candidatus Bathyarchaeia archaeon]
MEEIFLDWSSLTGRINRSNIVEHLKFFSSLSSRVTGYEGYYQAAKYIYDKFTEYGLNARWEYYNITIPIDLGANITILSPENEPLKILQAYPLWPNVVNPSPYKSPPEGDILIYGGFADFSDFTSISKKLNESIKGKFVLLDFNCRWYWKNAAILGAKGVIFIEPDYTYRYEAEQKMFSIPVNFPRLYVKREDGEFLRQICLKEGAVRVKISSAMMWTRKLAANIVATADGKGKLASQILAISAYYDSWSPVPSISPGATDALNPSILLELARVIGDIAKNGTLNRSVMFIALSGHWQGLWGAREFISAHFSEIGTKIKFFISIDLSTDSSKIAVYHTGNSYGYTVPSALQARYIWVRDFIFNKYLPSIKKSLNLELDVIDGIVVVTPPYEPQPLFFDSDVFTLTCYGGGLAFRTTDCIRARQKTPLDTFNTLNLENLWPQVDLLTCLLIAFLNDEAISSNFIYAPSRLATDWGFGTIIGQIARYNMTTGWFEPHDDPKVLEDAVVRVVQFGPAVLIPGVLQAQAQSVTTPTGVPGFVPPYPGAPIAAIDVIIKPDERGIVEFKGVKPYTYGLMHAYVINRTTGDIEYVLDLGVYGYRDSYSPPAPNPTTQVFYVYRSTVFRYLPVFRCSSIALLNMFDPTRLAPVPSGAVEVYNFFSHGWHIWHCEDIFWPEIMVYFPPETPTEIIIRTGEKSASAGFYYPLVILNNASSNIREGSGYSLKPGQTLILTPFEVAENIFYFAAGRIDILHRHHTHDVIMDQYYSWAEKFISKAKEFLSSFDYDKAYAYIVKGWVFARYSYCSSVDIIVDIVLVTLFFFLTMVPYSYVMERLVLSSLEGRKRILYILVIFMATIGFINLLHPGFHIATNAPMAIISATIVILSFATLSFIFGESRQVAQRLKEESMGSHFAAIERLGFVAMAFSVSVQNMRRRKFRSVLTLISLSLTVMSLISFTSIIGMPTMRGVEQVQKQPLYEGYLIRLYPWSPIPEPMALSIMSNYSQGALVCPRAWIHPPRQELRLAPGVIVKALLAMTPQEAQLTKIDRALISGRWFLESDLESCIISKYILDLLNNVTGRKYNVGSKIQIWGLNLTIVGIFDGTLLWDGVSGLVDLDGEAITPIDTMAAGTEEAVITTVMPHLEGRHIIIIPYRLAVSALCAQPISVAIGLKSLNAFRDAEILSYSVLTDVFASGIENNISLVRVYRSRREVSAIGINMVIPTFVLVAFIILNMMLSAIVERVREIGVYSSVGLAPVHISAMFLAESIVYALISSVLGYLSGLLILAVLDIFKALPQGFYPNFSSSFVIIAVISSIVTTISATIYPATKASRILTPSIERRFKLPKPRGDEWEILFPFYESKREAYGLVMFMKEYFEGHKVEGAGTFIASNINIERKALETSVSAIIWLAPYDAGIRQYVKFSIIMIPEAQQCQAKIYIRRETGLKGGWVASNYRFIREIRRQLLIWRTLPRERREAYCEQAQILNRDNVK